jgi:gliding motility-associated-like protein
MVMVSITYEAVYNDTIFTMLCMGDSLLVDGVWQFDTGNYPEIFVSVNGCDSIITTTVEVINCSVMVSVSSSNVDCAGTATGSITIDVQSPIDPPFVIEISSSTLSPREITINTETGNASFDNLPSGLYTVGITDANGVVVYMSTLTITEPSAPVSVTAFVIDAPTCEMPRGDVLATATGGATPYTYLWSTGGDNPRQEDLVPDTYVVTVTDNDNCTATAEIVIDASGDVLATIDITDPSCTGLADGVISVTEITGGEEPYIVLINEVALLSDSLINLTDGLYNIVIFDAQRCTLETMVVLESETIQLINDYQTSYEISTGDSVEIVLVLDPTVTGLAWTSTASNGECQGCTSFVVAPTVTTTFEVVATNADGCQEVVSITVIVDTPQRTQANIFSPNGDSVNEDFVVYAVPGSVSNTLFIYDRWGNTVLSREVAGNTNSWDGNNNGTPVVDGVYLYVLNSTLLDGSIEQEMGQVTVLR